MRELLSLPLMFIAVLPAQAKDDEAKINAVVEDRYKEWIAAASKKDAEALTVLYDENAVLMPKQEEPVIGKAAIGEYYKSSSTTRTTCHSRRRSDRIASTWWATSRSTQRISMAS